MLGNGPRQLPLSLRPLPSNAVVLSDVVLDMAFFGMIGFSLPFTLISQPFAPYLSSTSSLNDLPCLTTSLLHILFPLHGIHFFPSCSKAGLGGPFV